MTHSEQLPDILTIAETARMLRCSRKHVENLLNGALRKTPALAHVPIGRRKLIRRESLLAWIARAEAGA